MHEFHHLFPAFLRCFNEFISKPSILGRDRLIILAANSDSESKTTASKIKDPNRIPTVRKITKNVWFTYPIPVEFLLFVRLFECSSVVQ